MDEALKVISAIAALTMPFLLLVLSLINSQMKGLRETIEGFRVKIEELRSLIAGMKEEHARTDERLKYLEKECLEIKDIALAARRTANVAHTRMDRCSSCPDGYSSQAVKPDM